MFEAAGVDCCALLYDHRMTNPMIKILPALLTLAALATEAFCTVAHVLLMLPGNASAARRPTAPGRSRTTTACGKVIQGR